jgi:hypothetical protein
MKHLLFACLLLLASSVCAQTAPTPVSAPIYQYCALVVDDANFYSPNSMQLDYGRLNSKDPKDALLEEAEKQIRKAGNTIFALNYLSNLGWECFNVLNVQVDTTPKRFSSSETRYLFRRPK